MRIGVAHHLGWAVLVTATDEYEVVDRRRIELVDHTLPVAPIHHRGGAHEMHSSGEPPGDLELAALVAQVRRSAEAVTAQELDELARDVEGSIESISLRSWPDDFPTDIATLRTVRFESQADSVMYRHVIVDEAKKRGWAVHLFNGSTIEAEVSTWLGDRAHEVLHGPRSRLGSPWNKDHRMALAATIAARGLRRADR